MSTLIGLFNAEVSHFFQAIIWFQLIINLYSIILIQSAGAVENTYCISAEGLDSLNECPGYDTKRSDDETLVMLELWGMQSTPTITPRSTLAWTGST